MGGHRSPLAIAASPLEEPGKPLQCQRLLSRAVAEGCASAGPMFNGGRCVLDRVTRIRNELVPGSVRLLKDVAYPVDPGEAASMCSATLHPTAPTLIVTEA